MIDQQESIVNIVNECLSWQNKQKFQMTTNQKKSTSIKTIQRRKIKDLPNGHSRSIF